MLTACSMHGCHDQCAHVQAQSPLPMKMWDLMHHVLGVEKLPRVRLFANESGKKIATYEYRIKLKSVRTELSGPSKKHHMITAHHRWYDQLCTGDK